MDRYEKSAEFIMKRGDRIIVEKKHRKAIIMRSTALGLGAAAIVGVGICANALKPPKKPTAESSVYITETAAASETSESNAPSPTEQEKTDTKPVQTSKTGEAKTSSATTTQTSAKTAVITTASSAKTSLKTTTVSAVQTSVNTSTRIQETVSPETTTKTESILESPTTPTQTTISAQVTTITTTTLHEETISETLDYSEMVRINSRTIEYSDEFILEYMGYSTKIIGEYLGDVSIEPHYYTDLLPEVITAQVYGTKVMEHDDYVAVSFHGIKDYWVYKKVKRSEQGQNDQKEESL